MTVNGWYTGRVGDKKIWGMSVPPLGKMWKDSWLSPGGVTAKTLIEPTVSDLRKTMFILLVCNLGAIKCGRWKGIRKTGPKENWS